MRYVLQNISSCIGCGACVSACHHKVISFVEDKNGFWYPRINSHCVNCGMCERVCPVNNDNEPHLPISTAAACSLDAKLRRESSSGGVFSVLASEIIKRGGSVFGAAFDYDLSVHHVYVDNEVDLIKLRGSKYLQSRIDNSFALCKEKLDKGIDVLFSGTPCQISGLRSFLNRDYETLTTVDFICHGVPSPKVWNRYLQDVQRRFDKKITGVSFRDKSFGWKDYRLVITSNDDELQSKSHAKDPYMRLFLSDVILRPSCYSCRFKEGRSRSDITLADLWGIENILPYLDDDKGFNLVMANTFRGEHLLKEVKSQMKYIQVSHADAIQYNSSWFHSVDPHPKRRRFFFYFRICKRFENRVDSLLKNKPSIIGKTKDVIKKILGVKGVENMKQLSKYFIRGL